MYKILLLEQSEEYKKLFALNLNAFVGANTFFCESLDNVVHEIKNDDQGYDVIISRCETDNNPGAENILDYMIETKIEIPIICIGECKKDHQLLNQIESHDWKEVIRQTAKILKVTSKKMAVEGVSLEELYPIPIDYLTNLDVDECVTNIYVNTGHEYEIVIEKGEPFPSILIDEMVEEEKRFIYVKKEDRLKFVNQFSNIILKALENENITEEERISIGELCFDSIREQIKMTGMSEKSIQLAKKQVENMEKIVSENKDFLKLLQNLRKNSSKYLYQHSILTAAICTRIIKKLDWAAEQKGDMSCFISLFHDITLENDEQAKIKNDFQLRKSEMSKKEKKNVHTHALNASKLIAENPSSPYGAESVILQHHGMTNGEGFNMYLNNSLSQMTIIFIVAEEYADHLMEIDPEFFNLDNVISSLSNIFNKGMYKKVVDILATL